MDYSYYTAAPTPFQYLGFSSDSNGTQQNPQSDGFGATTSAPTQHFDPPFEPFDRNVYETNSFVHPHVQHHRHSLQSLQQTPVPSVSPSDSLGNSGHQSALSESNINSNNGTAGPSMDLVEQSMDIDPVGEELLNRARSSSEERDSMTPAQSKRKAQNRAAQRAFRERKERHVKELEAKLNDLEQASTSLHDENERLKRELAKVATENEILRATSSSHHANQQMSGPQSTARPADENMKTGPMEYTPSNFLTALRVRHSETHDSAYVALDAPPQADSSSVSSSEPAIIKHPLPGPLITQAGTFTLNAHRISVSPLTGQRLLASGATWDYIQAHPLFQEGLVDITDVLESLKGTAECNGTGPAFEERRVIKAIEDSAAKA